MLVKFQLGGLGNEIDKFELNKGISFRCIIFLLRYAMNMVDNVSYSAH